MKQPYLIAHYGWFECSECGAKYGETEYYKYYSVDKIMRFHINCKKCGAVFSEAPKRCFWEECHPGSSNACSECKTIEGVDYCTRQLRTIRERLTSWGCYYRCEAMKAPENGDYVQFTLL